jgi:hypothetical protein
MPCRPEQMHCVLCLLFREILAFYLMEKRVLPTAIWDLI